MWWGQDHDQSFEPATGLLTLAEKLGVDRSLSGDVVGAVYSFCRSRHGTINLSEDYLRFLTVRSALVAAGKPGALQIIDRVDEVEPLQDRMLFRTLVCASDPPSSYEAYRRGLIRIMDTHLSGQGFALMVDIGKIQLAPEQDLQLFWAPVLKQVALWVGEWRISNPDIGVMVIRESNRPVKSRRLLRRQLTDAITHCEQNLGLNPVAIVWQS